MKNMKFSNDLTARITGLGFTLFSSVSLASDPEYLETDFYHVPGHALILVVTTQYLDGQPVNHSLIVSTRYALDESTYQVKDSLLDETTLLELIGYAAASIPFTLSGPKIRFAVNKESWVPPNVQWLRSTFWSRFNNRYFNKIAFAKAIKNAEF